MTRQDVLNRVRDELDAAFPGDQAECSASLDDVDRLFMAVDAALDDCRGLIESQETKHAGDATRT